MTEDEKLAAIDALVPKIYAVLRGQEPAVIGAVLAETVARWLAGHVWLDDVQGYRDEVLDEHIDMVRRMLPVMAKEIGTPVDNRSIGMTASKEITGR